MQANRILSETKTSFVWHLAKQGKSIIVPKITYHGFCGTCAIRSTEVASSKWRLCPCLTRQIGHACLFAEQGNRVRIPDMWKGYTFLSSCVYRALLSMQKICVRWKPVIGRAVMARREGWGSALAYYIYAWMYKSEDLQTPASVVRISGCVKYMIPAGSRRNWLSSEGNSESLVYISYVTKAMV